MPERSNSLFVFRIHGVKQLIIFKFFKVFFSTHYSFTGFVAGIIAKFLHPGPNEPSGFILTTILGIAGAFLATFLGQALGWYRPDQGAGLIGAVVGAVIVLFIWSMFARRNTTAI